MWASQKPKHKNTKKSHIDFTLVVRTENERVEREKARDESWTGPFLGAVRRGEKRTEETRTDEEESIEMKESMVSHVI
jgi:hypothetical protein